MKRFVLIDGNAILHRAYHALPPLTTRSGELVNAVYGFTTMLLKVISDLKPQYLAVAFDTEKPTFRQMEYLGYQAQRPHIDKELADQIVKIHEILKAFGIPFFEVPGFEADDVIGTLAQQIVKGKQPTLKKIQVVIVTGDRDIMQLVGPRVKVYAPVRGLSEAELFDQEKVFQKMGVEPGQIVDYKGLVGDPSDNYPGIPGVGPKTAIELLKKYKSLKNIYRHLPELPEVLARKLIEGRELADLSYRLARIVLDAPVKVDLKKCQFQMGEEERAKASKKFQELGFKSLAARMQKESGKIKRTRQGDEQLKIV